MANQASTQGDGEWRSFMEPVSTVPGTRLKNWSGYRVQRHVNCSTMTRPIRFEYWKPKGSDPAEWWGRLYFLTEQERDDALSMLVRGARHQSLGEEKALRMVNLITAHFRRSKFATMTVTGKSVEHTYLITALHGIACSAYDALPEDRE